MPNSVAVLIVAAGRGSRLADAADGLPKQYVAIGGRPILSHTLAAVLSAPGIDCVLVVIHPDDRDLYDRAVKPFSAAERARLLAPAQGGATRQASVRAGLEALEARTPDFVLVHDAARPFVGADLIARVVAGLADGADAVLAAVPVVDTLKRSRGGLFVEDTVDRTGLWAAQTPQGFRYRAILDAHRAAVSASMDGFTDDTAVAEWAGMAVHLIEGDAGNYKITSRGDLERARRSLPMTDWNALSDIRVGTGYDVHAFEAGDAVVLGGISVPHERRLAGHSDADVVLHALTDAILGAIAEQDIGAHFPPSDPQWKGVASDRFLVHAVDLVRARGGRIAHLDVTVVCEVPKIGPVREAMRTRIASICRLPVGRVSVKATTSERLGFTGRKEGIAALATATVRLPPPDEEEPE
ncbi:bifunctional 2-C-methyl-D-erythritol 4-phosphate cytidylyltransferase/2-C-methyl-D-erythritol 2,4-cyclodiphosphate synthase [Polymorphum gilvum]|uniref:Bifunctional enzyme IspD/IspF n=1 Tax=Polymorphum gilvum (strain LMG 25793 / CGMCC 1.9160 / SL003B-26A1) TaxID=991905 RepID=F2J0P9_POLGS|nr:bifunctional 2-C-methyl-D-erythritol 4-phosphate cytidylyltransferase/2-C-methyl-D-erythritol 2,4-cyclodiphosphate synthase [Polymorphum gilvum]ADZ70735.1 2-C-methyl-D-erythritol 4-phosphate cytidylyltransferase/2-C-methyl-D-erythritol2, 4-cyclodiphosphate synthase protein [Polymorphum gilvum SL003B-26A1]